MRHFAVVAWIPYVSDGGHCQYQGDNVKQSREQLKAAHDAWWATKETLRKATSDMDAMAVLDSADIVLVASQQATRSALAASQVTAQAVLTASQATAKALLAAQRATAQAALIMAQGTAQAALIVAQATFLDLPVLTPASRKFWCTGNVIEACITAPQGGWTSPD